MAVADLNGDRKDDLAVTDAGYEFGPDRGGETVSVLLGTGSGGFDPAPGSPFSVDDPESVTVGDVNGDQRDDLAVISGNDVAVLLNNG